MINFCTAINKDIANRSGIYNFRGALSGLRDLSPRALGPKRLFEPGVTDGGTAARTRCYRWKKLICRSLLLSAWSPAVLYPLYPGAPAVVVVKDVVPTESSRGAAQKPPHGSVCIVTLIAKKVKLFFPARHPPSQPGSRQLPPPSF